MKFLLPVVLLMLLQHIVLSQETEKRCLIKDISIIGNKTTRDPIILNELEFNTGDTLTVKDLDFDIKKSKENLVNLSLFNYVYLNYVIDSNSVKGDYVQVKININVEERWYIWPYPILEHADRNFSSFIKDKDWDRINYGGYLVWYNLRGRDELLRLKLRYGFKEQFEIAYECPYIDKRKKHGIGVSYSSFRQHSTAINTENNKLVYLNDDYNYLTEFQVLSGIYRYRQELNIYHYFYADYHYRTVSDTVIMTNPDYLGEGLSSTKYLHLGYRFILDFRNLKYYPTIGYYLELGIDKSGFSDNKGINFIDYHLSVNKYFRMYNNLYYSLRFKAMLMSGENNAYLSTNALGYDDYLRGYEYYVIHGNNYYLFSQMIRWNIIPKRIIKLSFIPWEKVNKIHYSAYLGAFFDGGGIYRNKKITINNNLSGQFLYSYGVSLDLVTYYDKMIRIELARNKMNEIGLFIEFQKYF